ncbi:MAG: carbon monoxide dehydrogenase subunit G [Acidobacteria bacterium]|nr:carbon monoxide dehydrogenase subunit G [Acidobacteriota bacterium]
MAIKFGGEFVVPRKRDEVYTFLTDPQRFAPLLPEYQGMTQEDATHFTVKVRVGISYIRGTAEVKMNLAEAAPPDHAVYKGQGSVAGGSSTMTAGFNLQEVPEGTKVNWTGEAQVFGKLASVAGGLLEPLAKKNVEQLINGLKTALGGTQQPGMGAPASPETATRAQVPVEPVTVTAEPPQSSVVGEQSSAQTQPRSAEQSQTSSGATRRTGT